MMWFLLVIPLVVMLAFSSSTEDSLFLFGCLLTVIFVLTLIEYIDDKI